jgi:hypothetical protein
MNHATDTIASVISNLYHLIVTAIVAIEHALRSALAHIGVGGQIAELILIVVAVLLVIAALQLFGRIFAVLIALFLIFALLQKG